MNIPELLKWQWLSYGNYHQTRANLLIHIFAVPLFWLGTLGLIGAMVSGSWLMLLVSPLLMVLSMVAQGRGHRTDVPPVPFSGPANALGRIFLEQWINFPRYLLSGGWLRAWRQSR